MSPTDQLVARHRPPAKRETNALNPLLWPAKHPFNDHGHRRPRLYDNLPARPPKGAPPGPTL